MNVKELLKKSFIKHYNLEPELYFSCGGRFEILGNHTDHNHGKCIAGTCSLANYAAIRKRNDNVVNLYSEGFGKFACNLNNLDINDKEKTTPVALIRGIASYLFNLNYHIGGLDIYMNSMVPSGAGVSSSAAFELLIAGLFNYCFNDKKIDLLTLAKAGQYAERNYYGKMCGLLDQIGVSYGGCTYIDFKNIDAPIIKSSKFDLNDYKFLIIDSGSSHSGLDDLYKSIPEDMFKVAKYFNKDYLNEVDENNVISHKQDIIKKLGELPYNRAIHFYDENKRVESGKEALSKHDFKSLIKLMNESCYSSTYLLKNMYAFQIEGSPLELINYLKNKFNDRIGIKINGGGFAGSVICLILNDDYDDVIASIEGKYQYYPISLRNIGPSIFDD